MSKYTVFMGTTTVSATQTIGEISSVLIRAGARQIATDYTDNGKVEAVRFSLVLPGFPQPVVFRLPCRTEKLLKLLRNDLQAERTGWRQVLRWVQAQMAMIEVGMVRVDEVFLPYALIPGADRTMFQVWFLAQPGLVAKAKRELRGKVLACWCKPAACHGDVIARIIDREDTGTPQQQQTGLFGVLETSGLHAAYRARIRILSL